MVITRSGPIRCRWAYQSCGPQDDAGPGANILGPLQSIFWAPVWTVGRPDYWQHCRWVVIVSAAPSPLVDHSVQFAARVGRSQNPLVVYSVR
jgi:hypothetical protein